MGLILQVFLYDNEKYRNRTAYFVVGGGEGKSVTKYWSLLGAVTYKLCLYNISSYIHLV